MLLPDPDRPLFDAWRSGDRRAGDELFQRYFDDLNRFFRGKVNDNVIEELIHDSFLRCLNSIDRFSGQSTFRAYLFGIVRHVFLDHLRARYRRDWRTVSRLPLILVNIERSETYGNSRLGTPHARVRASGNEPDGLDLWWMR